MALSAETLRTMAKMGLTIDQAATLAEKIEADYAPAQRSSSAERQARYRERKKAEKGSGNDSDVTRDVTSVTQKEIPPTPPKEKLQTQKPITRASERDRVLAALIDGNVSRETSLALIEHRERLRKPLTVRAAELLAAKFARCRDGPEAAAEAMIANGWQGFNPDWMERNGERSGGNRNIRNGSGSVVSDVEAVSRQLEAERDRRTEPGRSYGDEPGGSLLRLASG